MVLRDFETAVGLSFRKGERYEVKVLHIGFCGGFERYASDNTMEGSIYPAAIVEFVNGKIMSFDIDTHVHIVGNVE